MTAQILTDTPVLTGRSLRHILRSPDTIITTAVMPIAFLLAYIFSKSDSSVRASQEIEAFEDQYVRAQTGFGASGAAKH